jgi:DNA-binding NarL/FixJ family response regulator
MRNRAILTHVRYGYTLKEIADQLVIHYTTVSTVLKNEGKQNR